MSGAQGAQAFGRRIVVVVAICASLSGSGCGARIGGGGGLSAHIGVDATQHADVITLAGGGPEAKALSLTAAEHELQNRHVAQKRIALDIERRASMGTVASFTFFATTNGFALDFPQGTPAQRAGGTAFADALSAALVPSGHGHAARPIVVDIGPAGQIVVDHSQVKMDALTRAIQRAATRLHKNGATIVLVVTPDPASDWGTTVDVMTAIVRSGKHDVRLGLVE
ncbi:MAG: hypothetical protein M3Z37_02930 [Candidatus Eremiobacteraeota bacterium]|nr:hypothetical protein [Candidatus Eremiobacteraeota bacterium]